MKKNEIIGFQLLSIETSEFAIIEPDFKDLKKVKISTALQFAISDTNNMIACNVITEFMSDDSQKLLKLKTDNHFKVKPEDWANFKNDNIVTLPKGFLAHLATISVGSARGILHCKTENTPYNKFILPLVNVVDMIPEDENFDVNN